jgi:trehalose 6-phosphate synthase/phosphatase
MNRLLIVSNRLPVTIQKKKGKLYFNQSVGGLATGLGSFYQSFNSKWVGWCGIPSERISLEEKKIIETKLEQEYSSYPVFLSKRDVELYYGEFCNKTLWPLLHGFTQYVTYERNSWRAFEKVNKVFANSVLKIAEPEDMAWAHDYHLMLLPSLLREEHPDLAIGFFLHTPFPSSDVFRLIPWREEILYGLLAADLLGFHTYSYVQNFLMTVRRLLGLNHILGKIIVGDHMAKVDSFPIGIDYPRFASAETRPKVRASIDNLSKKLGKTKKILSIDRLDYTKGVLNRLKGFDLFLNAYPEFKEKVTLVLVAVPSRTKVKRYQSLKKNVDELIGKINGDHGTLGWTPIQYIYRSLPFHSLLALYRISEVAMITPLRDGMNLIAKEYVATKTDGKGVLILSEMAGAVEELREAIIVNPNSIDEIAEALKKALSMPENEQIRRNRIMQERLRNYDIKVWAHDFMSSLSQVKKDQKELSAKEVGSKIKTKIIVDYFKSESRLIFLDYDGTLVPFASTPETAKPDLKLQNLLISLAEDAKNQVVIISGRNKESLEEFFVDIDIGLVAEHGAWIRDSRGKWMTTGNYNTDWKRTIRPILERFKRRTPGALVEEKDFSLVWHYRRADPELSSVRVAELKETLYFLTSNLELDVAEGNKIVEVKNAGINKGSAAMKWMSKKNWDFMLAVGDDVTDEDLFSVLPEFAYSIKVGLAPSKAKFRFKSQKDVRSLLENLRYTKVTRPLSQE